MTENWGKIQIFTGNGKGKTTAAIGTALRAFSCGRKIAFVFFDKGGDNYSENLLFDQLKIVYYRTGLNRIDSKTGRFRFGVTDEDRKEGEHGLKLASTLFKADLDLLVLDEIVISASLGIVSENSVLELMDKKPAKLELILTGRNASKILCEKADLVSEMNLAKHYFYDGFPARKGLDY